MRKELLLERENTTSHFEDTGFHHNDAIHGFFCQELLHAFFVSCLFKLHVHLIAVLTFNTIKITNECPHLYLVPSKACEDY